MATRILALLVVALIVANAADEPTITVRGPTIVAFFEPLTDAELAKDPDSNEALSDFQLYAAESRKAVKRTGIAFEEIYARAFTIRLGDQKTTFRPSIPVGYYFVAPARKPRVVYGVRTSDDLLAISKAYFGKTSK